MMLTLFHGYYPIYLVFLAVTGDEILQGGKAVGTSSNQVLLGMLVVTLIIIVIYLGRKQERTAAETAKQTLEQHTEATKKYDMVMATMQAERQAFGEERRARIESLMKLLTDNSVALNRTAQAEQAMATAVDGMKLCIHSNTEVTRQLVELMRKSNGGPKPPA